MNHPFLVRLGVRLWVLTLVSLVGLAIWLMMGSRRAVFSPAGLNALRETTEGSLAGDVSAGHGSQTDHDLRFGALADGGFLSSAVPESATSRYQRSLNDNQPGLGAALGSANAGGSAHGDSRDTAGDASANRAGSSGGSRSGAAGFGVSGAGSGLAGGSGSAGGVGSDSGEIAADDTAAPAESAASIDESALSSPAPEGSGASATPAAPAETASHPGPASPKGGADGETGRTGLLTLADAGSLDSFDAGPATGATSIPDLFSPPSGSWSDAPDPAASFDALVTDLGGLPGGTDTALPPPALLDLGAPPAGDVTLGGQGSGAVPEPSLSLLCALGLGAHAVVRRYRRQR